MKIKDRAYYQKRVAMQLGILSDMGYKIDSDATVLDLGCGNGNLVKAYRENGYESYGCDFQFKEGPEVDVLFNSGIIRKIEGNPYKLPFENDRIDFIVSDQVFEHVQDYPATLSEINRVLKPNGVSLHFFPSKYSLIEPHVYVPFASAIQHKSWLKLWALLGVRTPGQKKLKVDEVVKRNHTYLTNCTNYLSENEIIRNCAVYFKNIRFCEDYFFKYNQRVPYLYNLSKVMLFLPLVYSTLKSRVLFFSK